jgi:hypothetical protein
MVDQVLKGLLGYFDWRCWTWQIVITLGLVRRRTRLKQLSTLHWETGGLGVWFVMKGFWLR